MSDVIMNKIERYALNFPSKEVIDYYDTEVECKEKVGQKVAKIMKKVSDLSNSEHEKLLSSSWTKHLKNTETSIVKHSLIKLSHFIIATAVETKTYSEYDTFKKKM